MKYYEIERSSDGEKFRINVCEKCESVLAGMIKKDRGLKVIESLEWGEGSECVTSCAVCRNIKYLTAM
jgi:hypothetical protein